jgi:hypothetical protein
MTAGISCLSTTLQTKQYDLILEGEITVNHPQHLRRRSENYSFLRWKVKPKLEDLALYITGNVTKPIILTEDGDIA